MDGTAEKYCKLCGRVIAVRAEGIYDPRWNALCYCEDCRAAKRKADKSRWKRENRRDCRRTNKQLKAELRMSRQYVAELEEKISILHEENLRGKYQQSVPAPTARGGFFSALRRGQSGDKAEFPAPWRTQKEWQT